jgi:hypothetical protein
MREEGPELLGSPHSHLGGPASGRLHRIGRVADHIAPPHRILQRPMQDRVDVLHRLGRQAPTITPTLSQQGSVEGIELGGGEPLQLNASERRQHMGPDLRLVVRMGRRPQLGRLPIRQPLIKSGQRAACGRPRPAGHDGHCGASFTPPSKSRSSEEMSCGPHRPAPKQAALVGSGGHAKPLHHFINALASLLVRLHYEALGGGGHAKPLQH